MRIMRIGIDLGGTKIEAIAIDGADVLLRRRVSAPRGDYAATVTAVRDLVAIHRIRLHDHHQYDAGKTGGRAEVLERRP